MFFFLGALFLSKWEINWKFTKNKCNEIGVFFGVWVSFFCHGKLQADCATDGNVIILLEKQATRRVNWIDSIDFSFAYLYRFVCLASVCSRCVFLFTLIEKRLQNFRFVRLFIRSFACNFFFFFTSSVRSLLFVSFFVYLINGWMRDDNWLNCRLFVLIRCRRIEWDKRINKTNAKWFDDKCDWTSVNWSWSGN